MEYIHNFTGPTKHGQLCTWQHKELKQYCAVQPSPQQRALKHFIVWQSQIALVKRLKGIEPRFNRTNTSYGIKHQIEELSDLLGKHEYIGNEDVIIALSQAGFDLCNSADARERPAGPNYFFNITALKYKWQHDLLEGISNGQF